MKIKKLLCLLTLVISLFALTISASAKDPVLSPENPKTSTPTTSQGGGSGSGTTGSPQTSDEFEFSAAWVAVPVVLVGAAGVFTALSLKTKKEEN